jgi:hypothetical protein
MSMETHVFFRGKLPSKSALSRAMKELGFPFSITPATGSLDAQKGFMPMKLRGEETGVEFDVFGDRIAIEEFADAGVDASFERRASLRWGGDFEEAVAGMCVAAALAKLVDGVVFDEAEDRLLSVDDAIAVTQQNLQRLLQPEAKKRQPGTRPADLKRYLKPLLKQRSDLVLIGRLLVIRPVRHLLRGAFFDRGLNKFSFRVLRYVKPLFSVANGFGSNFCTDVHRGLDWTVWQPYFEGLLFDALDEDVFQAVSNIASLAQFDGDLGIGDLDYYRDSFPVRVAALVLAGQRERAAELIEQELVRTELKGHEYLNHVAGKQKALLERDVESLCAEFHAREKQAAEVLKLGDAWEPAPFPVELAAAERARRCDDPPFLTKPWIPRPLRLVDAPPDQVGEVRFAHNILRREGRVVMFVAFTREEAEEKHRTRQDYVLAARLPDGNLIVVRHHTGWSPHDPKQPRNPNYVPTRTFYLEAYGARGRVLRVNFSEPVAEPGPLKMWSVDVYEPVSQKNIWLAHNDTKARTKTIHDRRNSPLGYVERPMTDSDVALCVFPGPRFGDFNELWHRVETYLQNEGFGTLRDNFDSWRA